MPLVKIYLTEGKEREYIDAIDDGIHQALMETWGIPEDDRFHILHEVKKGDLRINKTIFGAQRSDDVVVLHITTSPRTTEMKLAFYKRLPEILNEAVDLSPDDVFISIVMNTREDWSFGKGEAQLLKT